MTKKGGVVTGNKEAGQEEHMADTNKDKAICSNTTQTRKHRTGTEQTGLSGEIPDTSRPGLALLAICELTFPIPR